ncbi:MAG: hypothetical protein M3238_00645 [Actinomycetota bacterium]|nr:hypothetical protein [Actinomycetota bacterium]
MRRIGLRIIAALSLVTVLSGTPASAGGGGTSCYDPPTDGTGAAVSIDRYCFTPTVIHIEPGTTVTWNNLEGQLHAVAGLGKPWTNWEDLGKGDSVAFSFKTNGVYPYYCPYHLGMIGAVVVGNGDGPGAARPGNRDVVARPLPPPEIPEVEEVLLDETAARTEPPAESSVPVGVIALVALGGLIAGFVGARRFHFHGSHPE